jgi:DNA-binding NarL/FixJ family response regulator
MGQAGRVASGNGVRRTIRVLLVGADATVLVPVRLALAGSEFVVSADVDQHVAVGVAAELRPDLTLLVTAEPSGTAALVHDLATGRAGQTVVVITSSCKPSDVIATLRSGARGYLPDTIDSEGLARSLRCVLAGEIAVSRQLVTRVIDRMRLAFGDGPSTALSPLTPRQLQVLGLLREGLSNREIADRLCISQVTVRSHVRSIRRRVALTGRAVSETRPHTARIPG